MKIDKIIAASKHWTMVWNSLVKGFSCKKKNLKKKEREKCLKEEEEIKGNPGEKSKEAKFQD